MFKIAKPFYIRTISSLHAGSGNDLGIIDLPIQREKHTSFPKIESSSLKGALREAFETKGQKDKEAFLQNFPSFNNSMIDFGEAVDDAKKKLFNFDYSIHLTFGYDKSGINENIEKQFGNDTEFSGALGFSDARILFFPVRSAKGVFAWITCPFVLNRFEEELNISDQKISLGKLDVSSGSCLVDTDSKIAINNQNVVLEEYTFSATTKDLNTVVSLFHEIPELKEKLVILSDDDFKDFVNLSTEVITRTKIDNATGTVASGALFNEEYLPAETIMYYLVFASPIFQKENNKGIFKSNGKPEEELVFDFFEKSLPEIVQIGGNATIGKGIVKTKRIGGN
ncbi:MAG: type III-B CRISPR module RAMP protein Cmr4 [Melioribacteraceae bacterium]|nr:type III-B CRISPR module RAMP protein Cmr4 [Melioribacteraceae bacterium]